MTTKSKKNWIQISGVYYIFNKISKKGYIGSSKNIYRRFKEHSAELRKGKHVNKHLQFSWNKHGSDCFEFNVLCTCPLHYIYKLEQWFLDKGKLNCEYNICKKVLLPPVLVYTEEIRKKISESSKKRANTPKEKMRLKKLSQDRWKDAQHRKFMQEINKGEKHPQAKISEQIARQIKEQIFNTSDYYGKLVSIAKEFAVTTPMVRSIKYGKSWKFINV